MFLSPVVYDGSLQRALGPGDIITGFEPALPATDTTNTTLAYSAAALLTPVYVRNPAGVSTDTYPTADALVSALQQGLGQNGVRNGTTYRWRVINLSANLLTGAVTANTGVTMTRGNVLASSTKDFLITITNGTPLRTVTNLTTVSGSAVVSGFSYTDITNLAVGQIVTNAVANLQGQTIIGINLAALTVTMSGNANASASTNSITFSPTYTIVGLAA